MRFREREERGNQNLGGEKVDGRAKIALSSATGEAGGTADRHMAKARTSKAQDAGTFKEHKVKLRQKKNDK